MTHNINDERKEKQNERKKLERIYKTIFFVLFFLSLILEFCFNKGHLTRYVTL